MCEISSIILRSFHIFPASLNIGSAIMWCALFLLCVFSFVILPLSSPSFTGVRYCISGRSFLTVSNAHQIPHVGGLRGLISSNAFTHTKDLGEEITFKDALALHCTCGPPLAYSFAWKFCGS